MIENQIVRQLRGIAGKLTADPELQKNLMQEMFVHLVRMQTTEAGHPLSWYLKSCEFHARNYLNVGPGIDLVKRNGDSVLHEEVPAPLNGEARGNGAAHSPTDVAI